ncbi:MAG: sigma-70 family RNA polymerase sigma factor [Anaerolineae bacterium]|nr:sigma-70 family RNA polymerase sigma factor [Anaerolineae bacterium]
MAFTVDWAFNNDESRLLARAIQGDGDAFGVLYGLYMEAIYRYVFLRVGSAAEAEDLTEDVFVRAWEALPNYRITQHPFKSWLYRIAHNLIVDYHRKRKPVELADEDLQENPAMPSSLPEDIVEHKQEAGILATAIQTLDKEAQMVIVLRFVEGLSHKEVAEIIGKSEAASRVIQHRALAALNEYLGG